MKDKLIALGLTPEQADKVLTEYKEYIPKARFDEVNAAKKKAEETVAERDKQLEALKAANGNVDELKAQIDKLTQDNKAAADKYAADLKAVTINAAVERELTASGAKNLKAVRALLELENAEMDGENVKGLADQIKKLKEDVNASFLFSETQQTTLKGMKPGQTPNGAGKGLTKEAFSKMSYKERMDLYNNDKATYDAMVSQD